MRGEASDNVTLLDLPLLVTIADQITSRINPFVMALSNIDECNIPLCLLEIITL